VNDYAKVCATGENSPDPASALRRKCPDKPVPDAAARKPVARGTDCKEEARCAPHYPVC